MQNKNNEQNNVKEIKETKSITCSEKDVVTISCFAWDMIQASSERHIKRLFIALITVVAMLFISNFIWLYAWCQYDYANITVDSGTSGNANYIGNDGDIHNGTNNGEYPNENTGEEKVP